MLGELSHTANLKTETIEYDNFVDTLMQVIGGSGDNIASTGQQREAYQMQRSQLIMGELAMDERTRRNKVYLVIGLAIFAIAMIVTILFMSK